MRSNRNAVKNMDDIKLFLAKPAVLLTLRCEVRAGLI